MVAYASNRYHSQKLPNSAVCAANKSEAFAECEQVRHLRSPHAHDLRARPFSAWEQGDWRLAASLMKPADDVLQAWPVSRRVNSSKADEFDPTLIERLELAA